jgi:2,4-dienoyl-CoA reductase-like NADH-dependent reductase (Old Yellow Enzyme family)
MTVYKHLFSPVSIGTITAKNRLLMSAMSINFGVDAKGYVTDQLNAYFEARAKGGAGLMLVGGGAVHPTGLELPDLPTMWDDGCIEPLKKMVAAVKPYDVRFGVQLMHGGRQSYQDQRVAPSPIPALAVVKGTPEELTLEKIQELVASFGDAARRCREAGFDFVEIHGAHGYLINQFLAPNSNQRSDAYGGSFENRCRFFLEVFDDIKAKTGTDFPVGVRMNGKDYIENGFDLDEAIRLAAILEEKGADYLHVSAGIYGSTELTIPSAYTDQGCFIHLAEAVKKVVTIPVIAVGRIKTADMAESVLRDGKADLVAMGRAFLADPELPNKAREDRLDEIRPCIGCCLGCIHAALAKEPGGCVVNPDVGREYLLKDHFAPGSKKNVLVIGAGPAGMATARMAALNGHRVTLCESSGHLGGLMRIASKAPKRSETADILTFLENELQRLKVPVWLNFEFDADLFDALKPDTVVLASGSLPDMPIIKGLFKTKMHLCTVTDVLDQKTATGGKIIIIGGGQAGLLLADFLAETGKTVAVLNRRAHFADEMSSNDRFYLRERLKKETVTLYKQVSIEKFDDQGVAFKSAGQPFQLDGFDTVVIAEAMASVRTAKNIVSKRKVDLHIIGDAKQPRNLMLSLSEAEELGRTL